MVLRRSLALIVTLVVPTAAWGFCSEPSAPYCATGFGQFDDDGAFEDCRSEMESFKSEVEDYVECLKRKGEEAVDEYNNAVEEFNNRARG